MTFRPTPVQRPRIPIWVVAIHGSERSMARALRYDGIVAQVEDPAGIADLADDVARQRTPGARPFEIVAQGQTPPDRARAAEIVGPFAAAGATWWIDANWDGSTVETVRRRIAAGPPRGAAVSSTGAASGRR